MYHHRIVIIQRIFITHSHHDHYAGAFDLVQLMQQLGHPAPQVYKRWLGTLETERNREREHPELLKYLLNVRENDTIKIDECVLKVIETPGHLQDHLCFQLNAPGESPMLFTGDHIIGADSVFYLLFI